MLNQISKILLYIYIDLTKVSKKNCTVFELDIVLWKYYKLLVSLSFYPIKFQSFDKGPEICSIIFNSYI